MNMNLEQPSAFISTLKYENAPEDRVGSCSPDHLSEDNAQRNLETDLGDYSVINQHPKDKHNFVYLTLVMAGIGFLLPYNSFVNAVDFYQQKYDNHLIVFDISLTYIVVMLLSVCLTNLLVTKIHLRWRISFGYLVAILVLFSTTIFDIILNVFPTNSSYTVTLVCAGIVSFGCTVQQSSFYGYTSMLPRRFTQAVMLGESAAGFLVSLNRLVTKGAVDNVKQSTALFFILSSCLLMFCLVSFHLGIKTDFVRHYITLAQQSRQNRHPIAGSGYRQRTLSGELELVDEHGSICHENPAFQAEMQDMRIIEDDDENDEVKRKSSQRNTNLEENNSEDIDLNSPGPTQTGGFGSALPDILYNAGQQTSRRLQRAVGLNPGPAAGMQESGFQLRLTVANQVWTYMAAIAITYLVTLSLFPGIETEIPSCRLKSWMPVMLMAVFNLGDLLGKTVAAIPLPWTGRKLFLCSVCRFALIPLLMICASPRKDPLVRGEAFAYVVTAVLGLTNGYFGSIPMIMAPQHVQASHKEIVGNLMTLCYSMGLTAGSGIAYWLDDLLGPIPPNLAPYEYTCSNNISAFLSPKSHMVVSVAALHQIDPSSSLSIPSF